MKHDLAETAIRACNIHADHAEVLNQAFTRHVEKLAASPAGWHGADDIKTLEGLEGSFYWFENPPFPGLMTFKFDPGLVGAQGKYQLEVGGSTESGTFHSVPNNPAIGWAFIGLVPSTGPVRTVVVSGMMTDAQWTISIALLNKLNNSGPIQPPFSAVRQAS